MNYDLYSWASFIGIVFTVPVFDTLHKRAVRLRKMQNKVIYMMDSYIKSKGSFKIGPMISYSAVKTDENGQGKLVSKIMFQLKKPIHNIEEPYEYLLIIKVSNCLFARFNEKEENLQLAYSKLNLHAFENDIKLLRESYTIFVDKKESNIIANGATLSKDFSGYHVNPW